MHSLPFITFISSVYHVVLRDWKVLFKTYKNGFLAVLSINLCDVNIHYTKIPNIKGKLME